MYRQTFQIQERTYESRQHIHNSGRTFHMQNPNNAEFSVNLVQLWTNWILKANMGGSTLPCPTVNDIAFST